MSIKKVLICGLGALGLTYANKLKDVCELKILADFKRIEKYKKNIPTLNSEKIELDYILPSQNWNPDLVIITTKSTGLDSAINYLKNFIGKNTIILSLINGISSEKKLKDVFAQSNIIYSYYIGHSAMRVANEVSQDGIGKIVIEPCKDLENFFSINKINYEISKDIIYSQWIKLGVNIVLNQQTAIHQITVGELRKRSDYLEFSTNLLNEVEQIAKHIGINNVDNYIETVLNETYLISDDGKTSMYQDIVAKRKTEVDIFSGEIIRLGKIYGIKTPYNQSIYDKIKLIEKEF